MNINFEKNTNVSGVLTIEMQKADYEESVKQELKKIGKKAQMPGFRPGMVPAGLVKKMYGTQVKAEQVNQLLGKSLFDYIQENKINMLGEPINAENHEAQDIEKQDDFVFVFDIALAPEINITLDANDTVDYYDIDVTDEQVDAQVKQYAQRAGHPEEADTYQDRDILRGRLAELDADGQTKEGGIIVEKASLMPTYFKSDDQKALFATAKKNEVLTFNPSKAYEGSDAEIAALLKIEKDQVADHSGDFSFEVEEISRFVPAAIDQQLFDNIFGKDTVKSEEEFKNKIKENLAKAHEADSDYKLLLDLRAYAENKVGEVEMPTDLLKRVVKANNADKSEEEIDKNFDKSIAELKWQLIKKELLKANEIKVEEKDIKATAIEAARFQFAQYGMTDIPDEYLTQYASEMLKKQEQVEMLAERCADNKLTKALKAKVTLNHKTVSLEVFGKLFA